MTLKVGSKVRTIYGTVEIVTHILEGGLAIHTNATGLLSWYHPTKLTVIG